MNSRVCLLVIGLIPCTRGWVNHAIPAVIIQNICEELEYVSQGEVQQGTPASPSVALRKYLKNCDVRAISHVCKSWRLHATALMCLWRDIAFDVSEPKSIHLAANFLSLLEGQDVSLRIYAGFGHSDLPDPDLAELLSDLRRNIRRWVVFEYQGGLGKYHSYLDLPALNLRYFSDHSDSSQNIPQLFAGRTPSLHYLLVPSTRGWDSTNLSNLTEFHFRQSACGPPPSLNSLLNLFQTTPALETLQLGWLGSFVHDCAADATVSLPRLHTLQTHNTDFDTLAEHISTPNVRETTVKVDTPMHPSFRAPHALTRLAPIPILDQSISEVMVVVAHTPSEGTFRVRLKAPGGGVFDMRLILDTGVVRHWKTYITETLLVLTGRIRMDPGVILRLYLGVSPSRRQLSQGALNIHGGFARRFFRVFSSSEDPPVVSPPFTCRVRITNDPPVLDEDETQMFRLCLRSRTTCEAGIFVRIRHGSSPWLCAADFQCPQECESLLQVLLYLFLILS